MRAADVEKDEIQTFRSLPMPYSHFLVSLEGGEEEVRMNQFLQHHAVLKIDQNFFERSDGPMWAYAIRYEKGFEL